MKRTWNLVPVLQIVQKIPEIIALDYIYQLAKFGDLMSCGSKVIFKNALILTLIVTDLVNHGMVENTNT